MTTAECRFCLETDTVENLLSPCHCNGSSKYVHNDCLMQWYTTEPARGMRCNTCLTEYVYETSNRNEDFYIPHVIMFLKMKRPLFWILVYHWILLLTFNTLKIIISLPDTYYFYIFYQVINTIYIYYTLSALVFRVKNKHMYMKMWLARDRVILIFLHSYLLATLPETMWIGGMAAEYLGCLYFYAHYEILETINRNYTFRFLSR